MVLNNNDIAATISLIKNMQKLIKDIYEITRHNDKHDCVACAAVNELIAENKGKE